MEGKPVASGGRPQPSAGSAGTVRLLGPPVYESPQGVCTFVAERPYQLLTYLAARADWVDRDRLAALFWPAQRNDEARRNLRRILHGARRLDPPATIEQRGNLLRWPVATDLAEFDTALREGRHRDAVALVRGPFASGLDDPVCRGFQTWLSDERRRVELQRRAAAAALPGPDSGRADASLHTGALACRRDDGDATLHAALESAWQSIAAHDREVGARLAVMPDGFALEAARVVAGATLATMANLVDASLLQVTHQNGVSRFSMHQRLREYLHAKLDAWPEQRRQATAQYATYCGQPQGSNTGEPDDKMRA